MAKWMELEQLGPRDVSERLTRMGCKASVQMIRAILDGRKRPGLDTISGIQKISRGKVTFNDLYVPLEEVNNASAG